MALSNWDALCINEKAQPCIAEYKFSNGVEVRLRKCWLNIIDHKGWDADCDFIKPIVAQIYSSKMHYKNIEILSSFDEDTSTICFIVWTGYEHLNNVKGMMGIGTWGEDPNYDTEKYIGITDQHIKMLDEFRNKEFVDVIIPSVFKEADLSKCRRYNQGNKI